MKKTVLLITLLFSCMTGVYAAGSELADNSFSKHYDYSGFTSIHVSHAFSVELTFEDKWSVDIEVPDFLKSYLKIHSDGQTLRVGVENLPRDIQRKLSSNHMLYARISMPKLLGIKMTGATSLTTKGRPAIDSFESLKIDMSGASKIKNFEAGSNAKLYLDMSGASVANLTMDFNEMDIDISGASKLRLDGSCRKLDMDCSGASSAEINASLEKCEFDASGSSKINVSKDIEKMELELSGASKFESEGMTAEADVELSGASKAKLTVTNKLIYNVSGVSTLRVKDMNATHRGEVSRGSKIDIIK